MTGENFDLTRGGVLSKIARLSLPTIGTQLVSMAYSFADMFWLGRLSSAAVAASGTIAVFIWLSHSLQAFGTKGAEIGVSQSLGLGDNGRARGFLQNSQFVSLVLGFVCAAVFVFARKPLIGVFNIADISVRDTAVTYLFITALAMPFNYVNACVVAGFNASGNSALPFRVNLLCLALNAAIDPLFISTFGFGAAGAAIATTLCQVLACALMLICLQRYKHEAFAGMKMWRLPEKSYLRAIFRWGWPNGFEVFCFTFFIMIVSRFVASFGPDAMAVQRLGNQVDQFSYFVSSGFAAALTAYIGQNYGAGDFARIRRGVLVSSAIMGTWGVLTTANLLLFGRFFFCLFVPNEPVIIDMGTQYLHILAICQLVACLEGVGASVFRGYGRTLPPSFVAVFTNVVRVILAWTLSRGPLQHNGIWWAMAISAFLRGLLTYVFGLPIVFGKRVTATQTK